MFVFAVLFCLKCFLGGDGAMLCRLLLCVFLWLLCVFLIVRVSVCVFSVLCCLHVFVPVLCCSLCSACFVLCCVASGLY